MSYCGLPWWFSGKESTCQCRGPWFDSWSGEISCFLEQLSLCTTTEPMLYSPHAATTEASVPYALSSALQSEAHSPQLDSSPHSLQLQKAHAATKTQHSQNK